MILIILIECLLAFIILTKIYIQLVYRMVDQKPIQRFWTPVFNLQYLVDGWMCTTWRGQRRSNWNAISFFSIQKKKIEKYIFNKNDEKSWIYNFLKISIGDADDDDGGERTKNWKMKLLSPMGEYMCVCI